jgi:hypothetical protein
LGFSDVCTLLCCVHRAHFQVFAHIIWPGNHVLNGVLGCSQGMELIHAMLQRDAGSRISAEEALQHPWFAKHGVGEPRHDLVPAYCMWPLPKAGA